jgi:hypothetical protein
MPAALANPLVAVDANVVMDLGQESESALDALTTTFNIPLGAGRFHKQIALSPMARISNGKTQHHRWHSRIGCL